ncbi:MAG: L-rhamnose/proton symporter RhaT [Fulvivirga sp.]
MEQIFGIILHSIGGFSSASFYVPYNFVKKWTWITYWITLGFVAWIIMPTIGGLLTTPDLWTVLKVSSWNSKILIYVFGFLWGFGGLLAGLGLRYLGLSLGQSISLGVSAIVGTLVPAILDNKIAMLVSSVSGGIILMGFLVCIVGIIYCGFAGVLKDRLLTDNQKQESVKEFSAVKGFTAAILGGVFSACMALAINAGSPIATEALHAGTAEVFVNIPIFVIALAGGFTTNFLYSTVIGFKNKSFNDYTIKPSRTLYRNFFYAFLSGLMWYGQFFFYGMGSTQMGKYDFASWSIHMASIIIFSNLWGIWLKEWALVNFRTKMILWIGIVLLIISVIMIGMGNYLAGI